MADSRYWICEPPEENGPYPFGNDTDGIVDENEGGIIAYVHKDNAARVVAALRAHAGEE